MKHVFFIFASAWLALSGLAAIPSTVQVSAPVAPSATNSPYGAQVPRYGYGGFLTGASSLAQLQDTNWFPIARRTGHAGMFGVDTNNLALYQLASDLTTWNFIATGSHLGFVNASSPASIFAGLTLYDPTITEGQVVGTTPYQYNHDASVAWYQTKFFTVWNANTNAVESANGQVNLLSTSTDFSTWTAPAQVFIDPAYSANPVTYNFATDVQWQPNLLTKGTQLWCIWGQENAGAFPSGLVAYFSRLASPTGKWTNNALNLNITNQGRIYYPFPTQDPIILKSGRVVAPIVWTSTTDFGPVNGYPPGFFTLYKLVGVAYSDDEGVTWSVGGYTTVPLKPYQPWEPFVIQGADGSLRIWCRNLDYINASKDDFMLTAPGYGDGLAFGPLESAAMEVSTTRYGAITTPQGNRRIAVGPDVKDNSNPTTSRQNIALFTSQTGGADLTAGLGLTGFDPQAQLYPQGIEKDGDLYIVYSYGPIPRSINTLKVSPAPQWNRHYVSPRKNYHYQNQLEFISSAPANFTNGGFGIMATVTNTSVYWGTTASASFGTWMFINQIDGAGIGIADTRDELTNTNGVLFAVNSSSGLRLVSYVTGTNYNHDSVGITVPTNQWVYLGASVDGATPQVTFYCVDYAGTAQTSTVALSSPVTKLDGGPLYISTARPSSLVGKLNGRIRRLIDRTATIATADNHRYWHGLDQAALGAADWVGVETSPGTPTDNFTATDPNAGLNNATWNAQWLQTGTNLAGSVLADTVLGSPAIRVQGYGSAGIELPTAFSVTDQNQLAFSILIQAHPVSGSQIKLVTLGAYDTRQELLIRNPGVIEAYDAVNNLYYPVGSYNTNEWRPLSISIGAGSATYSDPNGGESTIPIADSTPRAYFGAAYVNTSQLNTANQFYVKLADLTAGAGRVSGDQQYPLAIRTSFPTVSIRNATSRLLLEDTDNAVTNYIVGNGNLIYLSQTGAFSPATEPVFTIDFLTPSFLIEGGGTKTPRYIGASYSDTSSSSLLFQRSLGTPTSPTAVTNGIPLGQVFFSGHNGTSMSIAMAEITARANGTWTNTSNPSAIDFFTTDTGSTTRSVGFTITPDKQLQQFATSPKFKVTASDGVTGWLLDVLGGFNALFSIQTNGVTKHQFFGDGSAQFEGNTLRLGGSAGPTLSQTAGSPEGAITAPVGSLYLRNNGGRGSSLYTKETGTGNTGWRSATPIATTASLGVASISANSIGVVTGTLAGLNTGSGYLLIATPESALTTGLIAGLPRITAANTFEIPIYNTTAGALGTTNTWAVGAYR